MQQRQKCCLHCPGTWIPSSDHNRDEHSCRLPAYVRGNLKLSSLRKCTPDVTSRAERLRGSRVPPNRSTIDETIPSCYDRFAIAKKFHAENLEHQPLPDRVDDSVFKNSRPSKIGVDDRYGPRKRCGIGDRSGVPRFLQKFRGNGQYAPILGCKVPTTNMDLAICWEAPLDGSYEPARTVHVDGTDGGPAPAIFTRVERDIPLLDAHRNPGKCPRTVVETYEAKFANVKNRCLCVDDRKNRRDVSQPILRQTDEAPNASTDLRCPDCPENREDPDETSTEKSLSTEKRRSRDDELCAELDSIRITDKDGEENRADEISSKMDGTKKFEPHYSRNCTSCRCRGDPTARKSRDRRSVNSACAGTKIFRRNGLPTKINVPRPKTPYAKRSFCIDTLTPPFSIVDGCRDADYPEHWRLTSVYQQSYKNPRKQRPTILNYD